MADTGTGANGSQGTENGSANNLPGGAENGASGAKSGSQGAENGTHGAENGGQSGADIDRLIQSAVERAVQKAGAENKSLKDRITELEQKGMTDAERQAAEIQERERNLSQREAELKYEKNKMYALTAIKNAKLDDGGTTAIELVDLVMADDEKGINSRVKTLETLVNRLVQAEVDKTFKAAGRNPAQGSGAQDGGKTDKKSEFASELGKKAAAESKRARSILDQYTGGKR